MGKIEAFMGPMFAGKTTALIRRAKELENQGKKIKIFKPVVDNRYGEDVVCSHDKISIKACNVKSLDEINVDDLDVVVVDEFHFFPSDLIDCCKMWKEAGKHVIVAGLDLDHTGNPIRFSDLKKNSEELKELADEVHLLKSRCVICGKEATMTERFVKSDVYQLVGGAEAYRPVCKEHHPKWKK